MEYAELTLTSQTWKDIPWRHQLFLIKPSNCSADEKHALLFVAGGSWKPELSQPTSSGKLPAEASVFAAIAQTVKTPVAVLLHVPHQPIFNGKREDEIIAYTFEEFYKTGDPEWPLLLPMVKSAVRAMDTVQQFGKENWGLPLNRFTVSGASKRGWTTWLTGAVDPRVVAIAPMVIDVLNMAPQMRHQVATFGAVSEQIADYRDRGLLEKLETAEGAALRKIVDPFHYRESLLLPKLVILATNDRYWPLDALNLYWEELKGPKYILYVPNNGHGVKDLGRLSGTLNALHQHVCRGFALPKLDWEFEENGQKLTLIVRSDTAPKSVSSWTTGSDDRDFRDEHWRSSPVSADNGRYRIELDGGADQYRAVFAEAVYECDGTPFYLSTNVRIVQPKP
jgi:PhoPQ-activated pathogenicity-related protein